MTDAIYRRIENGETPLVAAYKGSKQISFAIIATTLILVAVFLPLIFIEGISGTLFKETAITLSFSIVVSSFVALTLFFGTKNGYYDSDDYTGDGCAHDVKR